ncbi:hypothetical protein [Fischerella thermalis]|uniref:hypothetical protein n=1 Tax=Fischerella thermalis TaxID=372787 RepID=UPI0002EBE7F2|nr:hypothetical protein [Fischerella thermalis]
MAIASVNINSSTNRGGLYWLDKIKVFNQKRQLLITNPPSLTFLFFVDGWLLFVTSRQQTTNNKQLATMN